MSSLCFLSTLCSSLFANILLDVLFLSPSLSLSLSSCSVLLLCRPSSSGGVGAGGGLNKADRNGVSRKGGAKGPVSSWGGLKVKGEF